MTMAMTMEEAVVAAWQRCRDARPGVAATLAQFRAHLAAHRPGELAEADQVATWCLDDVYLVTACLAGNPAAIRAIEDEVIPIIDLALIGWDRAVIDETRQQLRAQLIVDCAGRGPLLAQYSGRGALRRWIRVVAAREAGKVRARDTAAVPVDDDALFDAVAPGSDPVLSAVKNDAAAAFRAAFVATLGELDRRERTVLRLHVLDGLTIDEIAPMYEVHRATVARWIASAKHTVLERTRRRLMHDLRLDAGEVDSLIGLVGSRIELAEDPLQTK
jgi:RNA polymerase sigma-70 factor, ECF subfamily